MANTYTQIHIHAVFAVQNRLSLIRNTWETALHKYITGIVQKNGHKLLIINGMPDHIHLLFGFRPTQSLSDLMQDVKGDSSKWINKSGLIKGKFSWQEGYGAFAYAKSNLPDITNYIERQKQHHAKKSFTQEYHALLEEHGIEFDKKYTFHEVE